MKKPPSMTALLLGVAAATGGKRTVRWHGVDIKKYCAVISFNNMPLTPKAQANPTAVELFELYEAEKAIEHARHLVVSYAKECAAAHTPPMNTIVFYRTHRHRVYAGHAGGDLDGVRLILRQDEKDAKWVIDDGEF